MRFIKFATTWLRGDWRARNTELKCRGAEELKCRGAEEDGSRGAEFCAPAPPHLSSSTLARWLLSLLRAAR